MRGSVLRILAAVALQTAAIGVAFCASRANSQTFTTLVQFTGTGGTASGDYPSDGLLLSGTTLYGMTEEGGVNGLGNLFSVGMDGSNYQNVVSFTGIGGAASGAIPVGSLIRSGTTLYGMTFGGGANGIGNIFAVGINGSNYQNLLSFTGTGGAASGQYPEDSLILNGTRLYGMTVLGGANGIGNIFSVGTNGSNYQDLISFTGTGGTASGNVPFGSLILNGTTLYGMTYKGGGNGYGNVFSAGTNGSNYQDLVSFTGPSGGTATGETPSGSLTVSGTTLYGTTGGGGVNNKGIIFSVGTDGSNYQNCLSFTGTGGTAIGGGPFGS